jgi:outer membrane biosynthesis protein TonB
VRKDWAISAAIHAIVLALAFVGFSTTTPLSDPAPIVVSVNVVDGDSKVMQGTRTAPKAETPKPLVDKVGEQSPPVKDPTPKLDKQEIAPTAEAKPTPPAPKPEPPKPPPPQEQAKPDPAPQQPDPIAEALKRDEAKKKEEAKKAVEAKKKEEAKKKLEAKKREQEKFNTSSIETRLALLDKRAPQRNAATGATINQAATLGTDTGSALTLSASVLDALRQHLKECWDVPTGVQNARDLVVTVHIKFRKDGTLAATPEVVNESAQPLFHIAAESAVRAVRKCEPFSFLPVAKYDAWKELEFDFDPREMFGG